MLLFDKVLHLSFLCLFISELFCFFKDGSCLHVIICSNIMNFDIFFCSVSKEHKILNIMCVCVCVWAGHLHLVISR